MNIANEIVKEVRRTRDATAQPALARRRIERVVVGLSERAVVELILLIVVP